LYCAEVKRKAVTLKQADDCKTIKYSAMWLIVQRECTFSDTMIYNVEYIQ